jgi:predicted transcriptional regulator
LNKGSAKVTRNNPQAKLLTETELEFMNVLWKLGEGTVNDVLAHLPKDRKLAYTSVSTILRILETKGVLTSRKEGRGHQYVPKLTKKQYEATTLRHVVDRVFEESPAKLVQRLLETEDIDDEELQSLKKLLEERLG